MCDSTEKVAIFDGSRVLPMTETDNDLGYSRTNAATPPLQSYESEADVNPDEMLPTA